jgi:lambda repressor-like predicted transcriptional regulator
VCKEASVGSGDEADELARLRKAFPGYRFRRRNLRGAPCYVAEGGRDAEAPLAAARSAAVLADMLAAALGRAVPVRGEAVAAAYRDRGMTVMQCAAMFGVSRTTIAKILADQQVPLRRPGAGVDEQAVVVAYRDRRMSLHECAARFGISQRRLTAVLDRHGVKRRPAGRPPQHPDAAAQHPEAAAQHPEAAAQHPEAAAQHPEAPAQHPEAPAQHPEAPAQHPEAPAQHPEAPAQHPDAAAQPACAGQPVPPAAPRRGAPEASNG